MSKSSYQRSADPDGYGNTDSIPAQADREEQLKEKGLKFYEVDLGTFREKVESVYLKNAENVGGMSAIEALAKQ